MASVELEKMCRGYDQNKVRNINDLPQDGYIRIKELNRFVSISRSTLYRMIAAGRAPKPLRLSSRVSLYKVSEVKRFLNDPTGYKQSED